MVSALSTTEILTAKCRRRIQSGQGEREERMEGMKERREMGGERMVRTVCVIVGHNASLHVSSATTI